MNATWGRSLTLRLTLLFALAAAVVLVLLGLLIGNQVERHFAEQDLEALTGKMEQTRLILQQTAGRPAGSALVRQLDATLAGHNGLAAVVSQAAGQILYANDQLQFPPELFEQGGEGGGALPLKWTAADGRPWRGLSSTLPAGVDGQSPYVIAIATEISHHEHFMAGFRGVLWVFIILATCAIGLLGWVVVRRGLAPLHGIKRQAAEITAHRLHTRLPTDAIPLELADLADSLNDMLSRLEESFQRLSDFSSDLAHELRTPVSNLLTQTQVTLTKVRPAEEYRDILASNIEEFERLSRMIADMLFLAKADNHQVIPHLEHIELADEVADLLEFYGMLAEDKEIRLAVLGTGQVTGDRLMLRRAVSNLLSNALRHTPNGGTVTIRISSRRSNVMLAVENTGPGIPAEHLPRLFDRFYRADSSRQRTSEGSGLGLAITRSILNAHGGEVSVHSAAGATQFTLSLPVGGPSWDSARHA